MGGRKWKVAWTEGLEAVSADLMVLEVLVQWHGRHEHNH